MQKVNKKNQTFKDNDMHIFLINGNGSMINSNFRMWKNELQKELKSFWKSIAE